MQNSKIAGLLVCLVFANLHLAALDADLANLSLEQKIGQLFVVTAIVNQELIVNKGYRVDKNYIKYLIANYHIGGIIFMGLSDCENQVALTREFQQTSNIPLIIMQDLEWGLTMRLKDGLRFPRNQALGALAPEDDQLIYRMGYEIGKQCKALGVHVNLAPVADVNNNSDNPVINDRSFGESVQRVAQKSEKLMQGLQDARVVACAKHFPGHGDTNVDSHHDLPCIKHHRPHLDKCELYPFKHLISKGIKAVMVGHMEVPALEPQKHLPSSLSANVVTKLLQQELGFVGICMTDALDMEGVTKYHQAGELELRALQAGNDILLSSSNVPAAIANIKQALLDGRLSKEELDAHVAKILTLKKWAGCGNVINFDPQLLCSSVAQQLKQQLYSRVITIARDDLNIVSDLSFTKQPLSCIKIGSGNDCYFTAELAKYRSISVHHLDLVSDHQAIQKIVSQIQSDTVIMPLLGMVRSAKEQFGVSSVALDCLGALSAVGKKVVVVAFGNAYSLPLFQDADAVLIAYENDIDAQHAAAHVIAGKARAVGVLPVLQGCAV